MTNFVQVLSDHADTVAQLVGFALAGGGLYWQFDRRMDRLELTLKNFSEAATSHWKRLEDEMDRLEGKVDRHIEHPNPHASCTSHDALIKDLIARLDRIQSDIRQMLTWLIKFGTRTEPEED